MDLFSDGEIQNLLPYDGEVKYYGKVLSQKEAVDYFNCLLNTIEWKNDEAMIFGKLVITKRKTAWYGDAGFSYTYSNITRHALAWTKELLSLKKLAEKLTGATYNSCLLNLYQSHILKDLFVSCFQEPPRDGVFNQLLFIMAVSAPFFGT